MQYKFTDRLKHAWNVFKSRDPTDYMRKDWYGLSDSEYRPGYGRGYFGAASDKSIVTAIKNRIAVDAAQVDIQHVRLDDNNRFLEVVPSGLNRCLSIEANIDQTGRAFRLDIFMSLLDEGVIALVPIDTDLSPDKTGGYDILNLRVGKITQWKAKSVQVSVYNENTGKREEIFVPKKTVAIVENPFYAVMNEPNSTFQRLIHKLALLDSVDEQASQGKLDLIIQLPYVVKGETRRQQALNRRKEIEEQLKTLGITDFISISAEEGLNIDKLEDAIVDYYNELGGGASEGLLITNSRHYSKFSKACKKLALALDALDNGLGTEVCASALRACLDEIGEVTGKTVSATLADTIFSRFCIGK